MFKPLKVFLSLLCLVVALAGCRKKALEEYYDRPDNLAPPIYKALQEKGGFTNLLAVIDKSGFKGTLNATGYWTFFAPNDAAFQKYFQENNTSLDKIDSALARKIVGYCLVYNGYQTDHIADFQSPTGWVSASAFKRKTAYYDGFYNTQDLAGQPIVAISNNRNAAYVPTDNNNKHIPYFYSSYMAAAKITETDYKYFFPNSTLSDFNVVDAKVLTRNFVSENGIIHEVDRVLVPLPNIEQKLALGSQYSKLRNLFEKYMVSYGPSSDASNRYTSITGKSANVFVKQYNSLLAYGLNNENYLKIQDNDAQIGGYTLFAPNNAAIDAAFGGPGVPNSILEFYNTLDLLPSGIVADFLNAHMYPSMVWPTRFATTLNALNEPARFNSSSDVTEKQFCSNGLFYGTSKVQASDLFNSVYTRSYLDPAYSLMTRLFNTYLKPQLTNPGLKFTVFMVPDATLAALGYGYNTATNQYTQTVNNVTTSGTLPLNALIRIMYLNVVQTSGTELQNLSGNGIIETSNGEYIRWSANTVFSSANFETGKRQAITGSRDYPNGRVYYLDNGFLDAPTKNVANGILANTGTAAAPGPYYDFYQYLINSTAYVNGEIAGIQDGANYTIFIPTRAAMQQAVKDGLLPGTVAGNGTVTFTYNPTTIVDKDNVQRFIQYHMLNGISIATDGKKGVNGAALNTFLKDSNGNTVNVNTFNQPDNLTLKDSKGRTANVLGTTQPVGTNYFPQVSNYLANRTVIHQIDNYLRYNY